MGRCTQMLKLARSVPASSVCAKVVATLVIAVSSLLITMPVMAQSPWPGQSGNPVGYAAIGPLNDSTACPAMTSGTAGNPTFISDCYYGPPCPTISQSYIVFMSVDFICSSGGGSGGGLTISGNYVTLYGSRVQANSPNNSPSEVHQTGSYTYVMYSSFTPFASVYSSPPGAAWPAASAGTNATGCSSDAYCINGNDGNEAIWDGRGGPTWLDHIDTWGFGGALYSNNNNAFTITESWAHDNADSSPLGYHTDGITGYLNGGTAPANVTVIGNVSASIGNTNGLAFQSATGGYNNEIVNENYFSGYGYTIAFCAPGSTKCASSSFEGNTWGTDIYANWGSVYPTTVPTTSFWGCNKVSFRSGTAWSNGNGWAPTSADNGKYIIPSSGFDSSTDYLSNTVCGQTNPAALDFKTQAPNTTSSGQTVTLTNTGSSTLTISSIALASGTQFAISGNTCQSSLSTNGSGSSLLPGASCNITVSFTPTALGPQTDTLKITDNMASPASPQLVPLIGLGYDSSSSSVQAPAAPVGLAAVVQ